MKDFPEAKLALDRASQSLAKKYRLLVQGKLQNPRGAQSILDGYRHSLRSLKNVLRRQGPTSLPTVKRGAEELRRRLENSLPERREQESLQKGLRRESSQTIQSDVSLQKQLQGQGQLRDLRTNPNLRGIDLEYWLQRTPAELKEARDNPNNQEITRKMYRLLMKAFEKRDLGKRGQR